MLPRLERQDDEADDVPSEADKYRVQKELLEVLHAEGEARTRRTDHGPRGAILLAVVSFVVGLLLGSLGALQVVTSRITALETRSQAQAEAISELRSTSSEVLKTVTQLDTYVRTKLEDRASTKRE